LLSTLIIYLALTLPSGSIGLPTLIPDLTDKNGPFIFIRAYLTFQLARFTMRLSLLAGRWALTPPFHYHPDWSSQPGLHIFCGTFCSRQIGTRAFTRHDAQCCPDFPYWR